MRRDFAEEKTMTSRRMQFGWLLMLAMLLTACTGTVVETVIVEVPPEEQEPVVVVVTNTPEPTATEQPLTGPRATAARGRNG